MEEADSSLRDNYVCGAFWLIAKFGALCPEGRRFESHSSHHIGTLGLPLCGSFTYSCLLFLHLQLPVAFRRVNSDTVSMV